MHTQPKEAHLIFQGGAGVSQNKHIVNGKEREKLFSGMAKCNFIKHKFSMSQKIDY